MSLPTGPAVTFFFSDIETSTRLAKALGADGWQQLLAAHDRFVDDAVDAAGGVIVKHEGDGVFAAFSDPADAVAAAVAFSRALTELRGDDAHPRVRVRIGIHTGEGRLTGIESRLRRHRHPLRRARLGGRERRPDRAV